MASGDWEVPRVVATDALLEHAKAVFPEGGTGDDGTPSYEFFCHGPLNAATWDAQRSFEEAPETSSGIRVVGQQFSKFFGPLEFLARERGGLIELLDFVWDPNYWETVGDDPKD